jgi:hypothetical protein
LKFGLAIIIALFMIALLHLTAASYTVTHITTLATLNSNTSATVREVFTIIISNVSVSQYDQDRTDLNLSLGSWQSLVGPLLVEHIYNPKSGVYNFKLFPGPPIPAITGQEQAQLVMSYVVMNVTNITQTAPRTFLYTFNPRVLNFLHGASGVVLSPNTTLTVQVPANSKITAVYPVPDLPLNVAANYSNVTQLSWFYQEPLSKFTLTFTTQQSIQEEVTSFFTAVYLRLGIWVYILIAAVVALFILYTYFKTSEK